MQFATYRDALAAFLSIKELREDLKVQQLGPNDSGKF